MDKTCNFCGAKNFKNKNVQYIYQRDEDLLVVNNVPCEECESCGEQYFEAESLKKIEADFDKIHFSGKKPNKQIQVPLEDFYKLESV